VPDDPSAANWLLDRARSDKAWLRLRSTPPSSSFRPYDKRFRSGFFGARIRIRHSDFAALALAGHLSRFAPAMRLLPAKASFQQDGADCISTHFRQTIWPVAQRLAQGFQGPGGRATRLRVRLATNFTQNPFALSRTILDCGPASIPRLNSIQAFLVEALHQVGDGIPRFLPGQVCSFCIGSTIGNMKDLLRPIHVDGRLASKTTNSDTPLVCQSAEWFYFSACHAHSPAFFVRITHSTADSYVWLWPCQTAH
jgi:hypothetical protein